MFALMHILDKFWEYNWQTHYLFIDFKMVVILGGEKLEIVVNFVYLGNLVTRDNDDEVN